MSRWKYVIVNFCGHKFWNSNLVSHPRNRDSEIRNPVMIFLLHFYALTISLHNTQDSITITYCLPERVTNIVLAAINSINRHCKFCLGLVQSPGLSHSHLHLHKHCIF